MTLGVSGKLIDGNLIMYDTESDSLWHQMSGEAREGDFAGEQLAELPEESWGVYRWKDWLRDHPETLVLTDSHLAGVGRASGTIDELHREKAAAEANGGEASSSESDDDDAVNEDEAAVGDAS